ncbi:MAG TPA: hypothetical protein VN044_00745 [Verrucomicrobiae bacterium]|nr:hypothetical protein [Verrucomicrobiae bacterium]
MTRAHGRECTGDQEIWIEQRGAQGVLGVVRTKDALDRVRPRMLKAQLPMVG